MDNESTNVNLEPDFNQNIFYTVEKGDTIHSIAEKVFGDSEEYKKIMDLNGLVNPQVFAGQILRIPKDLNSNIISYRVKSGDTLWSVSESFLGYGPRYNEIMSLNGLTTDMIYPGQILKISIVEPVSSEVYVVRADDTLWKIAREKLGDGRRYTEIMKLNDLTNGNLRVGQKINLPHK